jgi:hypothetical protein
MNMDDLIARSRSRIEAAHSAPSSSVSAAIHSAEAGGATRSEATTPDLLTPDEHVAFARLPLHERMARARAVNEQAAKEAGATRSEATTLDQHKDERSERESVGEANGSYCTTGGEVQRCTIRSASPSPSSPSASSPAAPSPSTTEIASASPSAQQTRGSDWSPSATRTASALASLAQTRDAPLPSASSRDNEASTFASLKADSSGVGADTLGTSLEKDVDGGAADLINSNRRARVVAEGLPSASVRTYMAIEVFHNEGADFFEYKARFKWQFRPFDQIDPSDPEGVVDCGFSSAAGFRKGLKNSKTLSPAWIEEAEQLRKDILEMNSQERSEGRSYTLIGAPQINTGTDGYKRWDYQLATLQWATDDDGRKVPIIILRVGKNEPPIAIHCEVIDYGKRRRPVNAPRWYGRVDPLDWYEKVGRAKRAAAHAAQRERRAKKGGK